MGGGKKAPLSVSSPQKSPSWIGLTSKATRDADPDADPAVAAINNPTNPIFKITDVKLYIPVVTLSTENDKTLLEQLRTGFKRTIKWNKYRSEMTNQTQNNNLNYLIDPTFTKVNRLAVFWKWGR